jgi:hypothetical protein
MNLNVSGGAVVDVDIPRVSLDLKELVEGETLLGQKSVLD